MTSSGALPQLSGARVLVTGGDGLIGAAVVSHLIADGAEVTVLDREAAAAPVTGVRRLTGSVTDRAVVADAVAGQDAVVHLAGRAGLDRGGPADIYTDNALGTFLVLQASADAAVRKVVYASSINAFGLPLNARPVLPSRYPWDEDEPADIGDAYSLSKQANEAAALMFARRAGLSLTGLRYPLVRDIREDGGRVFGRHIRAALREDPRRQACEGWTYLDVRDAAAATAAALTHETPAAPGILVAAPRTYLRQSTAQALARHAPAVPSVDIAGRDVPVRLDRARELLEFEASVFLEDVDPDLLADLDELSGADR